MESQPTAKDRTELPFADGGQIAVVLLTQWLDWVAQNNREVFVALPMIQRGSVWDANRIANLWDSLLRGMPTGSLTVYRIDTKGETMVRPLFRQKADKMTMEEGSLLLLDGQQRTLAMCIGWQETMDRRVWVDFGQAGLVGQPFRLRVTTEYQPFGFKQDDQSKKLSRGERRDARAKFDMTGDNKTQFEGIPDYKLPLDKTEPYRSVHPLELGRLIQDWKNTGDNVESWVQNTLKLRSLPVAESKENIEKQIRKFGEALWNLFQTKIALVRVTKALVEHDGYDQDENSVPALVVLFQRIANAGAPLSNADYVFSLIKHRCPEAHNLVQELHGEKNVSSLLSANDLVMTAVRLALNTNTHSGGTEFTDIPTPTPKEFGRILRAKVDAGKGDFLKEALMPFFSDTPFSLHKAFEVAHKLLSFRVGQAPVDPGLPNLAFPLLQRQLVQVLVFWIHRRQRTQLSDEIIGQQFDASRPEILRFVLFWLLCVEDREKEKESAGKFAFEMLRQNDYPSFPGEALAAHICEKHLAVRLQCPVTLAGCVLSRPISGAKIRGWNSRFYEKAHDDTVTESQPLYRRWFHRKELLLWLQRKTLPVVFPKADPLARRDEETPYDYDHICPCADWGLPAYRSNRQPFEVFCEDNSRTIGNSIGNLRIEDSSSNRSDGDESPLCKLGLAEMDSVETQKLLENSAITREEADGWQMCSAAKDGQGNWDEARAFAFQKVVETRAFRLYEQYFKEGDFDKWVLTGSCAENSSPEIAETIEATS